MYLARKHTTMSFPEIGRFMGNKNHSTVILAERRIKKMLDAGKTPEEIIQSLSIRCLSRGASPDEVTRLVAIVNESPNPQAGLEDVFWAILNSAEFSLNH